MTPYLKCKDYTVSGEEFELVYDEASDMLVTHPQPSADSLVDYYQSEDYISHTDAKRNWMEWLYAIVKKWALKKKVKILNKYTKGNKTLLDVGAGTGAFLQQAKNNGWIVVGVEPNDLARAIALGNNVNIYNDLFSVTEQKFSAITLWHVLEHILDLDKTINYLNNLLEEDGCLFVAVPNYKSYDAKYYKQHWAAYDVPRHLWHFSQQAIKTTFKKHNLKVVKILPMKFDAYYVSLLSEKYKKNKFFPLFGFYRGFLSNLKASNSSEYSSLLYIIKKS
jgi:2-polyprenyl-3-methyl-5-hydroxy-6-metoxy-1,4-benzoquinol methylase